jgi:cation:H+ antiporter
MFIALLFLIGGLALLVKGADWMVDGAGSLAKRLGIAPIVIGLTVVAFGTSAPELVVNLVASVQGRTDIAIGNIIGSNIANILLILGVAGCIYPLAVKRDTTWKEVPLALLAVVLVWVMAHDRLLGNGGGDQLDRIDGIVLIAFFIIFIYYIHGMIRAGKEQVDEVDSKPLKVGLALTAFGMFGLIVGGKLTVDGAVSLARGIGVSERLIGLTVVSIGTSLPELLTSAVAAYRKKADLAIGNVVGSNIFNVFWVLGLSSIIKPLPFSQQNSFDVLIAVGATFLLFLAMFVGKRHILERWQAVAFLGLYAGYLAVLIVQR